MSFEVYLQCFHLGESAGFRRQDLRELFGAHVDARSEADWWHVVYDEINSCDIDLTPMEDDNDLIHGICVHRPCGDRRLWQSLLRLMAKENVVLYFPGDSPPLVVRASVAAHLPADMVESLGQPAVVADPDEILEYIRTA